MLTYRIGTSGKMGVTYKAPTRSSQIPVPFVSCDVQHDRNVRHALLTPSGGPASHLRLKQTGDRQLEVESASSVDTFSDTKRFTFEPRAR